MKIIPISKESLKIKKESLIKERLDAIQICDYIKADKILKEIHKLNIEIYYT